MATTTEYDVQILIASGMDNPCRAQLGFQTALASMASNLKVVVFLSTSGVLWGLNTRLPSQIGCGMHSIRQDIHDMIKMLREGGVRIEICSSCVGEYCSVPRHSGAGDAATPIIDGLALSGLTTVAIRSASVNTLTF